MFKIIKKYTNNRLLNYSALFEIAGALAWCCEHSQLSVFKHISAFLTPNINIVLITNIIIGVNLLYAVLKLYNVIWLKHFDSKMADRYGLLLRHAIQHHDNYTLAYILRHIENRELHHFVVLPF